MRYGKRPPVGAAKWTDRTEGTKKKKKKRTHPRRDDTAAAAGETITNGPVRRPDREDGSRTRTKDNVLRAYAREDVHDELTARDGTDNAAHDTMPPGRRCFSATRVDEANADDNAE